MGAALSAVSPRTSLKPGTAAPTTGLQTASYILTTSTDRRPAAFVGFSAGSATMTSKPTYEAHP